MSKRDKNLELTIDICIFFAANPDEELKVADGVTKFNSHRSNVWRSLSKLQRYGYVKITEGPRKFSRANTYGAGPELLRRVGLQEQ